MKLFMSSTSPFARKVRIAMHEKAIACDEVDAWAAGPGVGLMAHNPLGKVPTLVLDDGTDLFDSVVIVEYLDALVPTPKLIPDDPRARALVRRWEALGDGIAEATVLAMLERHRPEERRDPSMLERQQKKIAGALTRAEAEIGPAFAIGDAFSLADIAMLGAIGYVRFRFPELWSERYGRLSDYAARFADRPSIAATVPQPPRSR